MLTEFYSYKELTQISSTDSVLTITQKVSIKMFKIKFESSSFLFFFFSRFKRKFLCISAPNRLY